MLKNKETGDVFITQTTIEFETLDHNCHSLSLKHIINQRDNCWSCILAYTLGHLHISTINYLNSIASGISPSSSSLVPKKAFETPMIPWYFFSFALLDQNNDMWWWIMSFQEWNHPLNIVSPYCAMNPPTFRILQCKIHQLTHTAIDILLFQFISLNDLSNHICNGLKVKCLCSKNNICMNKWKENYLLSVVISICLIYYSNCIH